MIFDSSVWIDYLNGIKSVKTNRLDEELAVYDAPNIFLCPSIVQEVLQGIKDPDTYENVKDLIITCRLLTIDPYFAAERAAHLYRTLRAKGVTINKPNDCLIAYYAIHFKLSLVHSDKDFDKIAKYTPLKIYAT